MMLLLGIWAIQKKPTGTEGLTVYDCQEDKLTFTTVDLIEPERCADPENDYEAPRHQTVQLLQTATEVPVLGYQCKVSITKEVTRCGFDSIQYGTQAPVWEKDIEVTPAECRQATSKHVLSVDNKVYEVDLGKTTVEQFYSHGWLAEDGSCTTTKFESGGMWFEKSYERTTMRIRVQVLRGTADGSTGKVVFANGLRANFADGVLRDAMEGTIVWDSTVAKCADTTSEVYYGAAKLHEKKGSTIVEGILMIEDDEKKQYAGLVLRQPQSVCRVRCYSTQIKGLVACLLHDLDTPLPRRSFKEYFDPTRTNLQTQLAHLHLSTNMRMYDRFETVQADLCSLDRRVLYNKLQAIAGTHNPYALLDLYGPGHTVYVAGAAAYVARCAPVEAIRADFDNCTEEVPVFVNGIRQFADPYTWVLKPFPTVIPCSDVMPVRWKISGLWYCATPQARPCPSPHKLNISVEYLMEAVDFTRGIGQGIFTPDQLEQNKVFRIAHASRRPVLAEITNTATGHASGNGHLGHFVADQHLEELSYSLGFYILPAFWMFGTTWHYVTGALMLLFLVKILVGSLLRAYVLYLERGVGFWIVGACWHTVFMIMRAPIQVIQRVTDAAEAELEHGLPVAAERALLLQDKRDADYADLRLMVHQLRLDHDLMLGGAVEPLAPPLPGIVAPPPGHKPHQF